MFGNVANANVIRSVPMLERIVPCSAFPVPRS
jgi:hypothetical protein